MSFTGIDVGPGGSRAVRIDTRGGGVAAATIEHEPRGGVCAAAGAKLATA